MTRASSYRNDVAKGAKYGTQMTLIGLICTDFS